MDDSEEKAEDKPAEEKAEDKPAEEKTEDKSEAASSKEAEPSKKDADTESVGDGAKEGEDKKAQVNKDLCVFNLLDMLRYCFVNKLILSLFFNISWPSH